MTGTITYQKHCKNIVINGLESLKMKQAHMGTWHVNRSGITSPRQKMYYSLSGVGNPWKNIGLFIAHMIHKNKFKKA